MLTEVGCFIANRCIFPTPQTAEKYIPMIEDDDMQIGALLAVNKLKAAFLIAAKPEASARVPTDLRRLQWATLTDALTAFAAALPFPRWPRRRRAWRAFAQKPCGYRRTVSSNCATSLWSSTAAPAEPPTKRCHLWVFSFLPLWL